MKDLYKIGDIAKLCNISIKTLRYYEEMKLIKPVEVDIYSGYRYYDEENIRQIYKIQFLKGLDLSLQEIKEFDVQNLNKQLRIIEGKMEDLKKQKKLVTSLIRQKGEKIMKPFINDEQAIGKWKFIGSALSKEAYLSGDFIEDNDILFQEIVFLPEGEGYWVFDHWTKGEIYHFQGMIYSYQIENNKLFLSIVNREGEFELVCVYEKVDSNHYTEDDIRIKDNINLPFVDDKAVQGKWNTIGFISINDKDDFSVELLKTGIDYPLKGLTFNPNGELIEEFGSNFYKQGWTKGSILNLVSEMNCAYEIKTIQGKDYLFFEWKSGDYQFGGRVFGCYVLERA